MNICIFSDLHGNEEALKILQEKAFPQSNEIWCLGDVFYNYKDDDASKAEAAKILNTLLQYKDKNINYVKGNCDVYPAYAEFEKKFLSENKNSKEITGLKTCFIHGHEFENDNDLQKFIITNNYKIIFTGHSHKYCINPIENYILINPGSPSVPRNPQSISTIAFWDTDKKTISINEITTLDSLETIYLDNYL